MVRPLLQLLGVDPVVLENWESARWGVRHPELAALGLVLVPLAAWLMHRRHRQSLSTVSPRMLMLLTGLRTAILALMFIVLSSPQIVIDRQIDRKPFVAVIRDDTQSMTLPIGTLADAKQRERLQQLMASLSPPDGAISRQKLAESAITQFAEKTAPSLAERFEFRYFALRDDLFPIAAPTGESAAEEHQPGSHTLLGNAVVNLLDQSSGRNLAAIVLVSDGQNTGGLATAQAAFQARRSNIPVFSVPIGASGRLKDLSIVDVFSPGLISKDDIGRVAVALESSGFDGELVNVQLKRGSEVLDSRKVVLDAREQQHLELTFKADRVGLHSLSVVVDRLAGETIEKNNVEPVALQVTDEKLRVLYLDGLPRWDYRFLRNALSRDPAIELKAILETQWRQSSAGRLDVPQSEDDLAKFDAVILGDVSPKLLTTKLQELIAEAVRSRGLGLIVAVGPNHMPHAFVGQPMEPLLPVVVEPRPGYEAPGYEAFRLEVAPDARGNEIIRFYDDAHRDQTIWEQMPEFYWCGPATRARPGAMTLLVNAAHRSGFGSTPILAHHLAGDGAVVYLGTDSTWRWRQNVGDRYFYKLWGQLVRFVGLRARRHDRTVLEASPILSRPGQEVRLSLTTSATEPITGGFADVSVRNSDPATAETTVRLTADPNNPRTWTGSFRPAVAGRYQATFASTAGPAPADFIVADSSEEFRRPTVDRETLESLALSSGGAVLEPWELDQLARLVKGDVQQRSLRRQQSVWDNWLVLAILVALYCTDVAIRRMSGLL